MILIISLNPSIDRWYNVKDFEKGQIFKTEDFKYTPGGKGINVAKVINEFNEQVMVTGFLGGRSGEYIEEKLDSISVNHRFVHINDETRGCIRILSDDGSQTEILEGGPSISTDEVIKFYELYRELIKDVDIVCASGSVPTGLPDEIYRDLIVMAKEQNKKFFLDTSGEALKLGIEALPFFIKPNKDELEYYLGCSVESDAEIIGAGKYLSEDGIEIVIISLGRDGSIVFHDGYMYRIRVPKVDTVNSVGAGDSMTGGFIASLLRDYEFEFALRVAAACGTANVMESEPGKVDMNNMKKIMNDIVITKSKF
ncbi:1-phosphofructokinase family hexose kinase [Schnuerera sp. xch1]|uniref:1-phosphofructokinase family hexose kinase n=1 Tax=Schnuerera sp. xch1 TaxID=2874283 RepID=UPI001CBD6D2F|nr:1-phosphofructokinase family hexose kinase [Schnuerera sp. xch1]MBZ2174552.1 1-phosphofructokinase family hexose kinase [Schnuerera sp. xch1]